MANQDTLALIQALIDDIVQNNQGLISGTILQGRLIDIVQSRGLCEVYQPTKKYYQNELIVSTDNELYKNLLETDVGENPNTNPEKWFKITNKIVLPFKVDLLDNTPGSLIIGDKTVNKSLHISYSIKRGALLQAGSMVLTNNTANSWVNNRSLEDDCGFTFSKTFNGNEIKLNWVDNTANGNDAVLSMIIININI